MKRRKPRSDYHYVPARILARPKNLKEVHHPPISTAYLRAHLFSIRNRVMIERRPQMCGCFSCCRIFPSNELDKSCWLPEEDGKYTAWCPYCGIDAIICEESGFPITPEFMKKMNHYWF